MRVSAVNVELKSNDILSMIEEFVKVEGLSITKLDIKKGLTVNGEFKKGLAVGFKATCTIAGVSENKLRIKLFSASLMSLGIIKPFRKLALKVGLKGFKEQGITVKDDEIIIDINKILEKVPFVDLTLDSVYIEDETIKVNVKEINFSLSKMQEQPIEVAVEHKVEGQVKDEDYIMHIDVNKVEDSYTKGREVAVEHIPEGVKEYKDYIMIVPDLVALIFRLFKDKRVPIKNKVILASALGYSVLPIDILPDKLPIIGSLDELTLIFFALNTTLRDVPIEIILENWQGKNSFVLVLKRGLDFLSGFTSAKNLEAIYEVVDSMI